MKFPFSFQSDTRDCGPTCLKMIAAYHGQHFELDFLKKKCNIKKAGVSMLDIHKTAKAIGFDCKGVKMEIQELKRIVEQIPVILHWNETHFVVVYKYKELKAGNKPVYCIADPAIGLIDITEKELKTSWGKRKNKLNSRQKRMGYALLIRPANKKHSKKNSARKITK